MIFCVSCLVWVTITGEGNAVYIHENCDNITVRLVLEMFWIALILFMYTCSVLCQSFSEPDASQRLTVWHSSSCVLINPITLRITSCLLLGIVRTITGRHGTYIQFGLIEVHLFHFCYWHYLFHTQMISSQYQWHLENELKSKITSLKNNLLLSFKWLMYSPVKMHRSLRSAFNYLFSWIQP